MKVIHLISGGDTGGAKTHVLSLLRDLNKTIFAQLVCFREGEFAQEAREMGIPVFRVVPNCGPQAGQRVSHLHFHVLAGRDMTWPPG